MLYFFYVFKTLTCSPWGVNVRLNLFTSLFLHGNMTYLYAQVKIQVVSVCKTVIKWMDCADIVEILYFFFKYWFLLLIFYVLIVLRQVTLKISIIQQFHQQYYCECRLLYRKKKYNISTMSAQSIHFITVLHTETNWILTCDVVFRNIIVN
jgi:hypothetical protein